MQEVPTGLEDRGLSLGKKALLGVGTSEGLSLFVQSPRGYCWGGQGKCSLPLSPGYPHVLDVCVMLCAGLANTKQQTPEAPRLVG